MQAKRYSPESFDGGILVAASVPYRKGGAMPKSTATITGEQRRAIYHLIRAHLGG